MSGDPDKVSIHFGSKIIEYLKLPADLTALQIIRTHGTVLIDSQNGFKLVTGIDADLVQ